METREVVTPETMPLERLEAEITELAGHLAAAECRWLLLIGELDRRGGYESWGCRSCAHWLSWQCGLDMRAARERVRVARALEQLPLITEKFAAGKLSYSKVRALTRVATPENEADLAMIGEHSTAVQVERIARTYRGVLSQDDVLEASNRRHAARFLRYEWDDDGSLKGSFRIPPELGALFVKAVEIAREQVPAESDDENGPAGPPTDHAATNIDALVMMAESFLANGPASRGGDRYQIVINADEAVLTGDGVGMCELEDGPALAPETAQRLACDASTVTMTNDADGDIAQISEKAPAIPPSTRRAVRRRDRGCRFPGCGGRVFTHLHHIRHRAQHGTNALTNLVELCWHHHRLVHEGGWSVRLDDRGNLVAIRPNGNVLASPQPLRSDDQRGVERGNCKRGVAIDPTTCVPRWYGDRLDLDHIITGLLCLDQPSRSCSST